MTRDRILAALLLTLATLVGPPRAAAQDLTPFAGVLDTTGLVFEPQRLGSGVYALVSPNPFGDNSGFVVGERGVLVIDSLVNAEGARAVQRAIRTVTDKPILYLVNTNGVGDHWFGNYAFPETTTVIAHRNAASKMAKFDQLRGEIAFFAGGDAKVADVRPRPADLFIDGGLAVDLGGLEVEVHHFGTGNTREDLVVYVPSARAAWTGNFMLGNHLIPLLSGAARAPLYLDAVTQFARGLEIDTIVPGHGSLTDPATAVPLYLAYLSDLAESVGRAARAGADPATIVERVPLRAEYSPEPGREAYARIFQAINTVNTLRALAPEPAD
jgi:glyoxylase-like metal-dependent hydrolase (beta-lactamase superfamily II)